MKADTHKVVGTTVRNKNNIYVLNSVKNKNVTSVKWMRVGYGTEDLVTYILTAW